MSLPRRTTAATAARKTQRARRLALDLAPRLPLLDDEWLCALARVVMGEVAIREQLFGRALPPGPVGDEQTFDEGGHGLAVGGRDRGDVVPDVPYAEVAFGCDAGGRPSTGVLGFLVHAGKCTTETRARE